MSNPKAPFIIRRPLKIDKMVPKEEKMGSFICTECKQNTLGTKNKFLFAEACDSCFAIIQKALNDERESALAYKGAIKALENSNILEEDFK